MSGKHFTPSWFEGQTPANSYRSLFKWGDPQQFKHPNHGLYAFMKQVFNLTDEDFQQPHSLGLEPVEVKQPITLDERHITALRGLVTPAEVHTDGYSRLRVSYGAGMIDALRLRKKIIENLPDVVITPRHREDVLAVVTYCNEQHIPVTVYGGGSSVTRGTEATRSGVTLDMSAHMNRVLSFNEINHTITVESGMMGPQLEDILNHAPERLGAQRSYTCGHFPQSFEYSSVGGWVVTRGAGQNSTYYGKIEDMVIAQEYVTPIGVFTTQEHPRCATGPDFDQIMIGSEGTFGVLTSVTLRVFHNLPQNRRRFSYMFRSWEEAQQAVREVMQAEGGFPSVFRLSDPEETDVAMKLYGIEGTPADSLLKLFGYRTMEKCLLLGHTDGEAGLSANVDRLVRRICTAHGAFDLSLFPVTQKWEKSRFRDPYLREDLLDYGILIDTLECAVTWEQMPKVHAAVRSFIKQRPQTVCMTHLSHAYPQGGNLYFIFIARMERIDEYLNLQYGILEAIAQSGAAVSHHHGVGKQTAPWLEQQIGAPAMDVIRTLRSHFDPNQIMNPGGTLGMDMSDDQRNKIWSKSLERK
ncbi:MAG TPA: FAD-binding oxidoreductase [Anaerolineaceae bacterium]|nr:FAD-binding oxidoreductase [Anaerolineaceae bacterium]HPN51541.1 FAD-binding oxidoreductase [Anaerolineaceae bacterium]